MTAIDTAANSDISLTVLMIVNNQDRSRDFYHNVLGAETRRFEHPMVSPISSSTPRARTQAWFSQARQGAAPDAWTESGQPPPRQGVC